MRIVIPVDADDLEEAKITTIDEASFWLFFEMEGGKPSDEKFYETWQEIDNVEIVILKSQTENVWQFMEQNIAVLVTSTQMYFEDIVEGYIFKELYDLNI